MANEKVLYDYYSGTIIIGNNRIHLTFTENEILNCLIQNRGKFLNYDQICEIVYGKIYDPYYKPAISTHISRMRDKLQGTIKIENKQKYGYRIRKKEEDERKEYVEV